MFCVPTALPETPHKALSPIAIVLFVPVAEPKALLPITILGSWLNLLELFLPASQPI